MELTVNVEVVCATCGETLAQRGRDWVIATFPKSNYNEVSVEQCPVCFAAIKEALAESTARVCDLEMEVAELECEVQATHTFFAGCTPARDESRDERPLPRLVIERCHAPDSPEMQLEHLEANMARLRDESRDEQPPFASKTPAGIETGL